MLTNSAADIAGYNPPRVTRHRPPIEVYAAAYTPTKLPGTRGGKFPPISTVLRNSAAGLLSRRVLPAACYPERVTRRVLPATKKVYAATYIHNTRPTYITRQLSSHAPVAENFR